MARTALRSVSDAIEVTRSFLLPLSIRRVAALALVALFMGTPGTPLPASPQFLDPTYWQFTDPAETVDGAGDLSLTAGSIDLLDPGTWPAWLLAVIAVGVALAVAYAVLGVLMRFVLVEALRTDAVRIRRDGRAHLGDALRVLGLRLLLWAFTLSVVAGATVAIADVGPWTVDGLAAVPVVLVAAVVLAFAWLIEILTLQFVVPTMIAIDDGVLAGWRRFWPTLRDDPVEYGLYGLVRIALGVAIGIAAGVAVAVVLGLAAVVLGTIAAIVVVLAGGLGSLGGVAIAVLGVLVAAFVALAIATAATVAVPFQCYLWIYALFVLGDLDAELDLIPERRAAVRGGDGDAEPVA